MAYISSKDVQWMFERLVASARAAGLDTSSWALYTGSAPNGISFKLLGANGSNVFATNGFLGMTKRDAYDAMHHYCQVFDLLVLGREGVITTA